MEIWHQSWKSWTGGDSLDNDYKAKEEMTQKVVQKMPPEKKKQKGDEIVGKNSTRKGVLRQRQKSKENFITKFDMCTRILPCYMSFIFVY